MSAAFSFTDSPAKRKSVSHLLAAMYNACNMGLYIESPNEFPEHHGLTNHRLSEFSKDNTTEITMFSIICLFTAILGFSNQTSYPYYIDKSLPSLKDQRKDLESLEPLLGNHTPKNQTPFNLVMSVISAAYKTAVTSTSLAALLKNAVGLKTAIIAPVLCGPGNFSAQFAIFAGPLVKKYNLQLSSKKSFVLGHILAFAYNLPNAALYFNAGDAFLQHIGVLNHRLIEKPNGSEGLLLGLLILSTAFLLISTQRSYSKKIANVLKAPEAEPPIKTEPDDSLWNRGMSKLTPFFAFESIYTATYKAAINYISLVAALFSFTNHLGASFAVATFCIPGNVYAQFSILKPEQKEKIRTEEDFRQKSEACCLGLFSRTIVQDPIEAFGLKNVTPLTL